MGDHDHDHEHHDDPSHAHGAKAHDHNDEHGRFSTGQEVEGETAEKQHRGDFAEG